MIIKFYPILLALIFPLLYANMLFSAPLNYKDFILGDNKKSVLTILTKQKYSQHLIYYDSNDRYISGIKVKPENSIKIIIKKYMEKEEILLVFDDSEILFDIYAKKTPMDIRDYIDYRIYFIETYGKPIEEQVVNGKHILAWSLNKKRNAIYLIYDSINENLIFNMRDTYFNMKYEPVSR